MKMKMTALMIALALAVPAYAQKEKPFKKSAKAPSRQGLSRLKAAGARAWGGTQPGSTGSTGVTSGTTSASAEPTRDTTSPARVDHRDRQSPVKDQADRDNCLAHAVCACLEAQDGMPRDLSEDHLHLEMTAVRDAGGTDDPKYGGVPSGIHPALLANFYAQFTVCEERWFPTSNVTAPTAIPAAATAHPAVRLASVERLRRPSPERLEQLLAAGNDVVIDAMADWTPANIPANGVMDAHAPSPNDLGHFVLAVGYDRARGVIIIKNSFGTAQGDRGYDYLTYAFIRQHTLNGFLIRGERATPTAD